MTRRCSHCSNNGHNSRTCPAARSAAAAAAANSGSGGVRLFGVRLTEGVGSMKKSASMGNLPSHYSSSSSPSNRPGSPGSDPTRDHDAARSGYASDEPTHSCSSSNRSERKKGTPWTEEEHRMFLFGLQKLGKGDWRGIARSFVASRTPTQVASHAQKYFIRQTNASRRKRRSSLFDMVSEMQVDHLPALDEQVMPTSPSESENTNQEKTNQLPSLQLGQDQETEPTNPSSNPPQELEECLPYDNTSLPPPIPPGLTFYPALLPMPYPFWPPAPTPPPKECVAETETHEVLKPTPVLPKEPINVDEVVGMSKLSIGEGKTSRMEPSALSLKLLTSRQSAFQVNPTITGADLSPSNSSPIHAV